MNKILFFIGMALFIVPIGVRFVVSENQKDLVSTYEGQWEQTDESEMSACLKEAELFNEELRENRIVNQKEYEKQLNLLGNGVMCSLEIPKIDLKLPVCHGTSEEVLSGNIGHLMETSLPIGGANTHCVLSGHRGLSNAELFTRLDELEKGDLFFVVVCNRKLGYQVSEIQVVEPENVECIRIQENKDLVSLVTCTPYGLNTHRLVVTGERIFAWEEEAETVVVQKVSNQDKIYMLIPGIFILVIAFKKLKKSLPFVILGLSLICPMESFAMGNKIEIQFPDDYKEMLLCTKVGDKIGDEYVLKPEYQGLDVDLNRLRTAKQMREAAFGISKYVGESVLIPIDSNGYGEMNDLEDGVYLIQSRQGSESEIQPVLVYLPAWSESKKEMFSTVTVIPKFEREKSIPSTGWENYEIEYLILFTSAMVVVVMWCWHKCLASKNRNKK